MRLARATVSGGVSPQLPIVQTRVSMHCCMTSCFSGFLGCPIPFFCPLVSHSGTGGVVFYVMCYSTIKPHCMHVSLVQYYHHDCTWLKEKARCVQGSIVTLPGCLTCSIVGRRHIGSSQVPKGNPPNGKLTVGFCKSGWLISPMLQLPFGADPFLFLCQCWIAISLATTSQK